MPSPRTFSRKLSSLPTKTLSQSHSKDSSSSYKLLSSTENGSETVLQVPRGYIAMYVGEEAKRYEVPVENLKFPALQELIRQSQDDDLDVKIDGPIVLASFTTYRFEEGFKWMNHKFCNISDSREDGPETQKGTMSLF